jgi:hypothetical protein
VSLTPAQRAALDHVARAARAHKPRIENDVAEIVRMSDLPAGAFENMTARIQEHARVAIHFHPDRPARDNASVIASMVRSGRYENQFETGLSNGGLSAHVGGARHRAESRLFGGAYDSASASERPKYGALDVMRHPDGPCPRFGSCYLVLRPAVTLRCSFTYLDSLRDPDEQGTHDELGVVVGALMRDAFVSEFALGERDLTVGRLVQIIENLDVPYQDPHGRIAARNLNHCIEAQIHGEVSLASDVELVVADPSFRNTETGDQIELLARTTGIAIHWHSGFALPVSEVPRDFRGPTMPSLAARVAADGVVDAHAIGLAAGVLKRDPDSWSDRGSYDAVLQELKLLWHVLVRYGKPL